jgi:glycosyltransferase involved in cell wall biosynthesis
VRNGRDPSAFPILDRRVARVELGISFDAQIVLFVGRLHPVKGLEELLNAVALRASSQPKLRLVLVGEGPLESRLRSLASRPELAGRVDFLGRQTHPEVARWIAASDLLCLPSYSEGCPNVVLEALSCGRPVVASRVGAVPDLISAESGILVPPGDVTQLSHAIGEALGRRWDEKLIASRSTRTWDDVAAETYAMCREVAQSAATRIGREVSWQ